jgi:hypothetical protein
VAVEVSMERIANSASIRRMKGISTNSKVTPESCLCFAYYWCCSYLHASTFSINNVHHSHCGAQMGCRDGRSPLPLGCTVSSLHITIKCPPVNVAQQSSEMRLACALLGSARLSSTYSRLARNSEPILVLTFPH